MIEYCFPVTLQCESIIRNFAIADIEKNILENNLSFDTVYQHKIIHRFPADIEDTINQELIKMGIPKILYAQSYIRKLGTAQGIHIDGHDQKNAEKFFVSAAINIPLKGCIGSRHDYYVGDYDVKTDEHNFIKFYNLRWKTSPKLDYSLELVQPYLLRVDKPHSAKASNVEDRWVFTMRFEGNPKFQDLLQKLQNQDR